MKNLSELFEGGTTQTQKKKKITFYIVCVTIVLLATMLLFLAILGIASLLSTPKDTDGDLQKTDIGKTAATTIAESNLYSGSLLILDENNRFSGNPSLVNMQNRTDRPKTEVGGNTYSILKENRDTFMATDAAAAALNKMLGAFYKVIKDDNIIISTSYDSSKSETQDAIYSSGEAFEFKYFHDYATNSSDKRSIYGVTTYSWIYTNAHKYGFVAVGASEPNVFRYVGVVHSTAMNQHELSFDEYMTKLKTATPAEPIAVTVSGSSYAIYYLAKDAEHTVPTAYEYTVSGNNVDGYIITVNLSKKVSN